MTRPYILELYTDDSGWYRWRLKRGGRIVADSAESYVTRGTLRRAVETLLVHLFVAGNVRVVDNMEAGR